MGAQWKQAGREINAQKKGQMVAKLVREIISHGTHADSFLDSQFMTIALSPFDTTPDGRYVLAICPTGASSRCRAVKTSIRISTNN